MFGFGVAKSALKTVASGKVSHRAQQGFGPQSPALPAGIVRVGRFFYVTWGTWIVITWYSAYVNQRTEPGQGPQIVLPGKPIINPPDRPKHTPGFANNVFAALTGNISGDSGPLGTIGGAIGSAGDAIGASQAGFLPGPQAYPQPISRTDQGVDFTGTGPVRAVQDGVVTYAGLWHGWPGTDGIVYKTAAGPVYVMEHFMRATNPATGRPFAVGDKVSKGQVIGTALSGYPWLETGFANPQSTGPSDPYNGRPDGTPMPGGLLFRKLLGYNS